VHVQEAFIRGKLSSEVAAWQGAKNGSVSKLDKEAAT